MKKLEFDTVGVPIGLTLTTLGIIQTSDFFYSTFTIANTGGVAIAASAYYGKEQIGSPEILMASVFGTSGFPNNNLAQRIRYVYGNPATVASNFYASTGMLLSGLQQIRLASRTASGTTNVRVRGTLKGQREGTSLTFDSADPGDLSGIVKSRSAGGVLLDCSQYESLGLYIQNLSSAALTTFQIYFTSYPGEVSRAIAITDTYMTSTGVIAANPMHPIQECQPRSPWSLPAATSANNWTYLSLNVLDANEVGITWTPTTSQLRFSGIVRG